MVFSLPKKTMQSTSLTSLIVQQTKDHLKSKDILSLPEDLQDIIRQNLDNDNHVRLFRGDVKTWFSRTFKPKFIAQYSPYYVIGENKIFYRNGQLKEHGYWYKKQRCWEHRYYSCSGQLIKLVTYNKYGRMHGRYRSYLRRGQLRCKADFKNGWTDKFICKADFKNGWTDKFIEIWYNRIKGKVNVFIHNALQIKESCSDIDYHCRSIRIRLPENIIIDAETDNHYKCKICSVRRKKQVILLPYK